MHTQGIIPAKENASKKISDRYQKKTYAKGATCIYGDTLYRAKADITTAEEWTAAHWEETNMETIRAEMAAEVSSLNAKLRTGMSVYSGFTELVYGNDVQYSFYGRTWDFSTLPTPKGAHDLSFIVSLVGNTIALAHMVISAADGHVSLYSEPGWSPIPTNTDIQIRGTIRYLIN